MHKFIAAFLFARRRRKEKELEARELAANCFAIRQKRNAEDYFALCGARGGLRALHRAAF